MEKASFWDHFWGTKKARVSGDKHPQKPLSPKEPVPDESLLRMINERRVTVEKVRKEEEDQWRKEINEKERESERSKRLLLAEKSANASNILEAFLASASENILEAAEKGHHSITAEVPIWDLPKDTLMDLKAFKDLEKFCKKYGLKLHCSDNSRTEYLDWDFPSWPIRATDHVISILF